MTILPNKLTSFSDLEIKVVNVPVVVPCIEVCFYLDTTNDELILDYYKQVREIFGASITHFQGETTGSYKPLTARSEETVESWFTQPPKGKLQYNRAFSGTDENKETSASTLDISFFRRPEGEVTDAVRAEWAKTWKEKGRQVVRVPTFLRFTLPLDHPMADPEKLQHWIANLPLVKKSTSLTGECGLALNHFSQIVEPSLHVPAEEALGSLLQRYPALGWRGGAVQAYLLPYHPETNTFFLRLKRANWLLLACDNTLAPIGGREAFRAHTAENAGCALIEHDNGVILRSGNLPDVTTIEGTNSLPLYHSAAKLIRPIRVPELHGLYAQFKRGAVDEWLNAFDQ